MRFTVVTLRTTVGHWNLMRGWETRSTVEFCWMSCSLCGYKTTELELSEAVTHPQLNHSGEEMRDHDTLCHPRMVAGMIQEIATLPSRYRPN